MSSLLQLIVLYLHQSDKIKYVLTWIDYFLNYFFSFEQTYTVNIVET